MSSVLYYSIADEIFEKYPGYVRGVVWRTAYKTAVPRELGAMLRQAEASVRERLNLDTLLEDPK